MRLALGELEHVTTLLGYLAEVGRRGRNTRLAEFCGSWEKRLTTSAGAVRAAAVELGGNPDSAIEPLDPSPVGRAAHTTVHAVGTVGEWVDRQAPAGRMTAGLAQVGRPSSGVDASACSLRGMRPARRAA